MLTWEQLGEIGTAGQLVGLDAVRLIGMIFAQHLNLIGNLLEQLKISELKKYPETREPLEQLEDALRRSYVLVNSCQDRSYLYLLAMGRNIVDQFKKAQTEIDRYLKLVPLITLVDNSRVKERLECIERDQCEYTLDEEDRKVQDVILNRDPSDEGAMVLKRSLSFSLELQRSQDISHRDVLQHLLVVIQYLANSLKDKDSRLKNANNVEESRSKAQSIKENDSPLSGAPCCHLNLSRCGSSVSSGHDSISAVSHRREGWRFGLLDCFAEPFLSSVARNRQISPGKACNLLMAYSLILSCCCYTCCVRRKLRKMLNITGGLCDDFLSHLICCYCALVQEWREVEARGIHGKTKTSPPSLQRMES
ncbi:unnamed protein product [Spirodela intermedia]|uniref:MCAfunc domain-containing protein n=1 Tax=Spirodela intermedia TaxID=51605 RepID=A0A7I8JAB5_SPIIN|nr:unnamed protein product [Spirodela intermedia]CAA6666715.1 unnamed protein product [Spirodela intermedia]